MGDRDYMKSSPEDEKRIKSYEEGALKREFGDFGSRRGRTIKITALVIIAVVALLWIAAELAG